MSWWQALILGIVQGLTEFLPISSSGHLMIVRNLIGVTDGNYLAFDVLTHTATLVAILIVLRKDVIRLFRPPFKTLGVIILVSVPSLVTGLLLSVFGPESDGAWLPYLCFFFLFTAGLLIAAEFLAKRKRVVPEPDGDAERQGEPETAADGDLLGNPREFGVKHAAAMGLMQAFAPISGISRSGSTVFGGTIMNGSREKIAKFSFFLSVPVILASTAWALFRLIFPSESASVPVTIAWYGYLLAMAAAFTVGLFAIKLMLRLIAKANYRWFALYLLGLSVFSFVYYFVL